MVLIHQNTTILLQAPYPVMKCPHRLKEPTLKTVLNPLAVIIIAIIVTIISKKQTVIREAHHHPIKPATKAARRTTPTHPLARVTIGVALPLPRRQNVPRPLRMLRKRSPLQMAMEFQQKLLIRVVEARMALTVSSRQIRLAAS